jgi:CO/xanthine dehydrogenase FAD-binding subunit
MMIRGHLFPETVSHAIRMKKELKDGAVFLAGGTDLFVRMAEEKTARRYWIDLTRIPELSRRERLQKNQLVLGACMTIDGLTRSPLIKKHAPLLAKAAERLGSPAIRNQATVGGNLVNASPAADLVPPLVVQGAAAHTVKSRGTRQISVEELSTGVNQTVLFPEEILWGISIPILRPGEGTAFIKLGVREALTIAVATVAAWLRMDKNGDIADLKIALGSVAPTVIRARQTENFLKGGRPGNRAFHEAGKIAAAECRPITDVRGTAEYRRWMVEELVKACLEEAWANSKERME